MTHATTPHKAPAAVAQGNPANRPPLPTQPETPEYIAPSLGLSPYRLRRMSHAYPDFPQPVLVTGPATHTRYYYDPQAVQAFVEMLFATGVESHPRDLK